MLKESAVRASGIFPEQQYGVPKGVPGLDCLCDLDRDHGMPPPPDRSTISIPSFACHAGRPKAMATVDHMPLGLRSPILLLSDSSQSLAQFRRHLANDQPSRCHGDQEQLDPEPDNPQEILIARCQQHGRQRKPYCRAQRCSYDAGENRTSGEDRLVPIATRPRCPSRRTRPADDASGGG